MNNVWKGEEAEVIFVQVDFVQVDEDREELDMP